MDKELREQVAKLLAAIDFCVPVERIEKELETAPVGEFEIYLKRVYQIDALYQAHYAEVATKEGLRPDNPYDKPIHSDNSSFILRVIEAKDGFDKGVAATLAKVMMWHESKVAEAVKAERDAVRERINKILELAGIRIGTIKIGNQIEEYTVCDMDGDEIDQDTLKVLIEPYYDTESDEVVVEAVSAVTRDACCRSIQGNVVRIGHYDKKHKWHDCQWFTMGVDKSDPKSESAWQSIKEGK
jgi:hypothetical protein